MKRKLVIICALCAILTLFLSSCDARETGSLKALTHPYIAQYECTRATYGEQDILEKFDYIKIILIDKQNMELTYKFKNGEAHKTESTYTLDTKSRELTAEIGLLGYKFKQTVKIENGSFTVSKPIANRQLILHFEVK